MKWIFRKGIDSVKMFRPDLNDSPYITGMNLNCASARQMLKEKNEK